jgi:hypothetical protein
VSTPLRLHRLGDHFQLVLQGPEDLARITELDPARWMANSAPVEGLSCDPVFLAYLDSNHDGRVQPDELVDGVNWLLRCMADLSAVQARSCTLVLAHIDQQNAEGVALHASAERILANLGKEGSAKLHIDQLRDRKRLVGSGSTNGDGVIPWEVVGDARLRGFVKDLATTMGPATDASGKQGATFEHLSRFMDEAGAWLTWQRAGEGDGPDGEPLHFQGEATHAAWQATQAVADKLEEFFALCELAAMRPDAPLPAPASGESWLAQAPIARPHVDGMLRVDGWLHPDWRLPWERFSSLVLERLGLADKPLSASRWARIQRRFRPYATWLASRPETPVAKLGRAKLEDYSSDPTLVEGLEALVAADRAVAEELAGVADVERLLLYQRHLLDFCNNFVSFSRFYDPRVRSLPEAGTLLMDGRNFQLCVRVGDRKAHKARAAASGFFLIYVQVQHPEQPFEVAVAVTGTHRGDLHPGKRGVFFTPDGRVLPAVAVDLLENPISVSEALVRPFERLGTLLAAQAERLTESRYAKLEQGVGSAMSRADASLEALPAAAVDGSEPSEPSPEPVAQPVPAAEPPGRARELLLSGGVALAALSSALAYIAKTLSSIGYLNLLIMALLLALCFTVPTAIVTALKLRKRDLAPVLEASGWGINYTLRVPGWSSPVFTRVPPLPAGASLEGRDLLREYEAEADSGAKDTRRRRVILLGALLVALLAAGATLLFSP